MWRRIVARGAEDRRRNAENKRKARTFPEIAGRNPPAMARMDASEKRRQSAPDFLFALVWSRQTPPAYPIVADCSTGVAVIGITPRNC
jgi:hypothetical protein